MQLGQYDFERFSTKDGFNSSLGHFQAVSELLGDFQDYYNLADILNILVSEKEIQQNQLAPIVYALLVDKYGYFTESINLPVSISDFSKFKKEMPSWKAVDVVLAYNHPQLGYMLINPKNEAQWDSIQDFTKNELMTIFAGAFQDELDGLIAEKAIQSVISMLDGGAPGSTTVLKKGNYHFNELEVEEEAEELEEDVEEEEESESSSAAAAPAPSKGKKRMTPYYSVNVTNELFHNGNVEAWKKIIQSFSVKNPGLDVFIFYDGERIHDINTLFKWGKVKHGSSIMFAVAGENIRDVAKLQRYLFQGASPKFEDFLRFPVNKVLNLF